MHDDPVTLVHVIDVGPAECEEVTDLLRRGLDEVVRHRPGFESATVLVSPDGGRVVNIARWRSAADAAATQADDAAAACARRVAALGRPAPGVFRVVHEIG